MAPMAAASPNRSQKTRAAQPLAVSVVVYGLGRLGELSYLVERDLLAESGIKRASVDRLVGRVVEVPVGKRAGLGIISGPADAENATKAISKLGNRLISARHLQVCREVANRGGGTLAKVVARAVPKRIAERALKKPAETYDKLGRKAEAKGSRVFYAVPPLMPYSELVERVVEREGRGQVLVVCPTRESAQKMLAEHPKWGELRTDSSWRAWQRGEIKVGVGARGVVLWEGAAVRTVVIVDESHPGHVEASQPYTSTVEAAVIRSRVADRFDTAVDVTLLGRVAAPRSLWGGVKYREVGSRSTGWPTMWVVERGEEVPPAVRAVIRDTQGRMLSVAPDTDAKWRCERCRMVWDCHRCGLAILSGGRCGCAGKPVAPHCLVCNSRRRVLVGWDPVKSEATLRRLGARHIEHIPYWDLGVRPNGGGAVVALFAADGYRSWAGDPGLESVRILARAAVHAGEGGAVLAFGARPGGAVADVIRTRSPRGVVKRAWEEAKKAGMAPFRREVTIHLAGPRPKVGKLDFVVHGPRPRGDGEWEMLVTCRQEELGAVLAWIDELRRTRGKLRVRID